MRLTLSLSLSLSLSLALALASIGFLGMPLAAQAALYLPGATLDPACAPTDPNCGISTIVASSTANSIPYYAANGGILSATSTITILSNGNFGLGTTSPYSLFSISNNLNTAANTPLFTIASTTGGTSTTTLMTVLANGNVGIGTSSPAYTLDVKGIVGVNGIQAINIPNQSLFIRSLYLGNGGANSTTDIGTNPLDPLSFETNGSFNGTRNTFVGINAGLANTTGNWNLFIGESSGVVNTIGDENTFVGGDTGIHTTTGYHDTFVGTGAGEQNIAGNYNTFVGTDAGLFATGGNENTFIGNSIGGTNSGIDNTFVGSGSAPALTTGSYNTFTGQISAQQLTTGVYNQGIGRQAGLNLTGGGHNTFLGDSTSVTTAGGVNTWVNSSTAIGFNAQITASNQVVIGGTNVTQTLLKGNIGIGTTSPFAILSVSNSVSTPANTTLFAVASTTGGTSTTTVFSIANTGDVTIKGSSGSTCTIGNGVTGTSCSSDERLKTNVALIVDPLKSIEQIRGVTFNWADPNKSQTQFIGVIAQDVQKVFPQAVSTVGGYFAVDYGALVAPLIEAVKELAKKVDSLAATVAGFADSFTSKNITATENITATQHLCVGSVCVDASQLKKLLDMSGQSPIIITDVPPPIDTSATSTATNTDSTATTTSNTQATTTSDTATTTDASSQ